MLVSPAEPPAFKVLGDSSSIPERYGADFLMFSPVLGRIGVQRKEVHDLVASIRDDRLAREIPLLSQLDIGIVLVEGDFEWTNDGLSSVIRSEFTKAQYLGILWSLQSKGLWTSFTSCQTETIEYLSLFTRWTAKDRHTTLLRRNQKGKRNQYGIESRREEWIHVLQGFPGMGYERSAKVVDFCGRLPLEWTVSLRDVPGIGDHLTRRLESFLNPDSQKSSETNTIDTT